MILFITNDLYINKYIVLASYTTSSFGLGRSSFKSLLTLMGQHSLDLWPAILSHPNLQNYFDTITFQVSCLEIVQER